jgi:sRNA-binding carbon storage regulator CsrA
MLVLHRKPGEFVDVDGPFELTYCGLRDGLAALGFVADQKVRIARHDAIRKPGDLPCLMDVNALPEGALVLRRRFDQRTTVDGECRVVVKKVTRSQVWIAFIAPPSTRILRDDAQVRVPKPGKEAA